MNAPTTVTERPPAPPSAGHRTLWFLQVVAALGFLDAAIAKLTGEHQAVATFHALGWAAWVRYLLAALELLGAACLLVPRLSGVAAIAFVGLTIGAITVQLITDGSPVMAVLLLGVSGVVAWGRRERTAQLWVDVRRRSAGSGQGPAATK